MSMIANRSGCRNSRVVLKGRSTICQWYLEYRDWVEKLLEKNPGLMDKNPGIYRCPHIPGENPDFEDCKDYKPVIGR